MKPEDSIQAVQVHGKDLICPHCGNKTFITLKGRIVTIAKLGWLNYEQLKRPTSCYVCSECRHMSEFLDQE